MVDKPRHAKARHGKAGFQSRDTYSTFFWSTSANVSVLRV